MVNVGLGIEIFKPRRGRQDHAQLLEIELENEFELSRDKNSRLRDKHDFVDNSSAKCLIKRSIGSGVALAQQHGDACIMDPDEVRAAVIGWTI